MVEYLWFFVLNYGRIPMILCIKIEVEYLWFYVLIIAIEFHDFMQHLLDIFAAKGCKEVMHVYSKGYMQVEQSDQ